MQYKNRNRTPQPVNRHMRFSVQKKSNFSYPYFYEYTIDKIEQINNKFLTLYTYTCMCIYIYIYLSFGLLMLPTNSRSLYALNPDCLIMNVHRLLQDYYVRSIINHKQRLWKEGSYSDKYFVLQKIPPYAENASRHTLKTAQHITQCLCIIRSK